ncbi:MAG: hypothetical protein ACRC3G_08305 [Bacteroidales bacterium]
MGLAFRALLPPLPYHAFSSVRYSHSFITTLLPPSYRATTRYPLFMGKVLTSALM